MQLKKFTRKDRHGNMMSFEFDVPQANVPAMQSIPMYDHPGEPKGTDTVPAWLTPGEFVVNKEATEMFGPTIKKMNDIGRQKQDQNKAMYAQEGESVADTSWITDDLLDALRFVETGNLKPEDMVSPKGAIGPYQIMPDNFGAMEGSETLGKAGYGTPIITEELAKDPEFARNWAKKYLEGIQKANPNFTKTDVLRAYNAGVGTVNKVKKGDTNFVKEAQEYPGKVFAALGEKTADKIPDVTVQRISPDSASSGAQVSTDAKFVPPVNVTMPQRGMSSMEPIPGPSSGRIAQVMGNLKPSDDYTNYLKNLRLKADDYFNNAGVIPRSNVTLDTRQMPGVNPMLDINQPAGVPIPTGVVDGKRVALTPEYLDAMQDNDMGGLGADSQVFKDFVGSRLRVPVTQVPPSQVVPKPSSFQNIIEQAAPGVATVSDEQKRGQTRQRYDLYEGTDRPTSQQELDRRAMENFNPPELDRLVDSMQADINKQNAPQFLSDDEIKRSEGLGKEIQAIDDFARKAGQYLVSPKEFKNERGLTGKQEEKAQATLAKMEELEPIQKGYDQKQKVATEIAKINKNQTGPGPDQPGNNADPDTVKNTGSNAPAAEQNKTTSFLKGLFGSLFDTDELKRMGVMYLGSRLMGYSHGGSLSFAVKNYLQRVDAKEKAAVKFATSASAAKAYTAKSLAKYAKSGDITDLVPLPRQLISTGNATTFYGNKNGKDFKIQVMEYKAGTGDNAPRVFLDKFGNEHNPLDYDLDPIYNKNSPKHRDALDSYTKTFADVMTSVREKVSLLSIDKGKKTYVDDVIPATDAGAVAAWALDNKVELPRMPQLIELAYRDMVEDAGRGYKATSIVGYLDSLKIRETILDGTEADRLFRLEPDTEQEKARGFGKPVDAKEFTRLRDNAVRWLRITKPELSGIPNQQVAIGAFQELVSQWNTLTDKQQAEWNSKASKTTTGFMEWSKASINNVLSTMVD